MTLGALPTQYDYTDPSTNLALLSDYDRLMPIDSGAPLADYDRLMPMDNGAPLSGLMPDYMKDHRLLWGAEYVPLALGAYYGFSRGGLVQALLWGLLGYMAPLPAYGAIVYEQQSGRKLFNF